MPDPAIPAIPSMQRRRRARLADLVRREGALVALVALCLFGFARYAAFLTTENLLNVLRQNSMIGLVSLGMTFVILTGGIDLSVGSILAVAGIAAAALSPYGTGVALVAAVALGAALGLLNGVLIARVRIQPFIVTLATMIAIRGVALATTGENAVALDPAAHALSWLGQGSVGAVPVPIVLLAVAYAIGWLALRYTRLGRHVYAVGDNPEAARLLGVQVDRVLVVTYVVSGACAALAGVVLAARLGAAQPVAGTGWELDAIAAVVVGGTALMGGEGGVGATLIGVLLLGVILNLLNLEGTISSWWQWVIRGVFLLGVVVVQERIQRKQRDALTVGAA